jgi:hypothetical protein
MKDDIQTEFELEDELISEVVVRDIDMPFWSMVKFMVKWSIAAIPAAIILFLLYMGCIWLLAITFSIFI